MTITQFKAKLEKMHEAIRGASKYVTDKQVATSTHSVKNFYDFKTKKATYYKEAVETAYKELRSAVWQLGHTSGEQNREVAELVLRLREMEKVREIHQPPVQYERMAIVLAEMKNLSQQLHDNTRNSGVRPLNITLPQLPDDIRDEMIADIQELLKCFDAGCYRSATVICGRILEIALHRKYYEVTGKDILETQPGIGLGNLVAKLKEKEVQFAPAVTQQIHLINQVRISSVHKKQQPFNPTKSQAHAMILYTTDLVEKMFK
jgi:hypothetical protein